MTCSRVLKANIPAGAVSPPAEPSQVDVDPTLEAKQRAVLHALEERRGCWAIHSSASSNTKTCTLPSASISNLANPSAISSAQAVMRASLRNSLMNVSNSVVITAPNGPARRAACNPPAPPSRRGATHSLSPAGRRAHRRPYQARGAAARRPLHCPTK